MKVIYNNDAEFKISSPERITMRIVESFHTRCQLVSLGCCGHPYANSHKRTRFFGQREKEKDREGGKKITRRNRARQKSKSLRTFDAPLLRILVYQIGYLCTFVFYLCRILIQLFRTREVVEEKKKSEREKKSNNKNKRIYIISFLQIQSNVNFTHFCNRRDEFHDEGTKGCKFPGIAYVRI